MNWVAAFLDGKVWVSTQENQLKLHCIPFPDHGQRNVFRIETLHCFPYSNVTWSYFFARLVL